MNRVRNSNKAILIRDKKLLLIVNKDSSGIYYSLPGGGQEFGETISDSLKRECYEETGIEIEIDDLLYVRDYIGNNHEFAELDSDVHQVELFFQCNIISEKNFGNISIPDKWQIGVERIELDSMKELRLFPKMLNQLIKDIGSIEHKIYLGDPD